MDKNYSKGLNIVDGVLLGIGECQDEEIIIPEGVKVIGHDCFLLNKHIRSVYIPEGVTSIEEGAFRSMSNLEEITLPNSLSFISHTGISFCDKLRPSLIEDGIMYLGNKDNPHLYVYSYKNNEVPSVLKFNENCKFIGGHALQYCKTIEKVEVPDSVTHIGVAAFNECDALKSVILSENLQMAEQSAFSTKHSLLRFNRFDNGRYLGSKNNPYLLLWAPINPKKPEIIIHEDCRIIGPRALFDIDGFNPIHFKSIEIPKNVRAFLILDDYTISKNSLVSLKVNKDNPVYDSRDNCNAIIETASNKLVLGCKETKIPQSVTTIGYAAFSQCPFTEITIPNGVVSIGERAFYYCDKLTNIIIPEGVKNIGTNAFYHALKLEKISLPDSLESIGEEAFGYCKPLKEIVIPKAVKSIGVKLFSGCDELSSIVVDKNNPYYDSRDNCNAIIETKNNRLVQFYPCSLLPKGIKSLGPHFIDRNVAEFTIPEGVEEIEEHAFYYSNVATLSFSSTLKSIGVGAFEACRNLKSLTIPEGVQRIEARTFGSMTKLESLSLPSSLIYIDPKAFYEVYSLNKITISKDNPVYDCRDNCDAIIETKTNTLIKGSLSTKIPGSVKVIGDDAFTYLSELKQIVIPEGVEIIQEGAFLFCDKMKNVSLPSTLTEIGDDAFNCDLISVVKYAGSKSMFAKIKIGKNNERLKRRTQFAIIDDVKKEKTTNKNEQLSDFEVNPNSIVKLTLRKDAKALEDIYRIEINVDGQKALLEPGIILGKRFIFVIEEWVKVGDRTPIYRFLNRNYGPELTKLYQSLPENLKGVIKEIDFLELGRKLRDKEDKTYHTAQFTFKGKKKAFVFYNPYKPTQVVSMMGVAIPRLAPLSNGLIKLTEEAVYYELEEMNYMVAIHDIKEQEMKDNPASIIEKLFNEVYELSCDNNNIPFVEFHLSDYVSFVLSSYLGRNKNKQLPLDFAALYAEAYQ